MKTRGAHDCTVCTYVTYTDWGKKSDIIKNSLLRSIESLNTFQNKNLHVLHQVLKIEEHVGMEEVFTTTVCFISAASARNLFVFSFLEGCAQG